MKRSTEALTLGETMVMVAPAAPGPIRTDADYRLRPGGAEANVALHLARLGHRSEWSGIVGGDPFGRLITEYLGRAGVAVDNVMVERAAPTGVYFKETSGEQTEVFYYRSNSAATHMSPAFASRFATARPSILHLSGITPALSASCSDMVTSLVEDRIVPAGCVSFDVNFRPALWSREVAGPALLGFAQASDVVFVGLDEATELWGVTSADDVRELLHRPRVIVVKNDSSSAVSYQTETTSTAEPEVVSVVEAVGAGDAFAAGWLSGLMRGFAPQQRLELGHSVAAHVLSTTFDDIELPDSLSATDPAVDVLNYL